MFDCGDALITEPRDTRVELDRSTYNKVDTIVAEPRDTRVELDRSTYNKVDTIVAEPHDTGKIQAELESIRANYGALLETSARITTNLREEVHRLRSALERLEASILLNRLKAKRKKATASLADIEAILEILEES
jgi:RNA:NAD 2'-phosphotransferase (TPT1/KptA family)